MDTIGNRIRAARRAANNGKGMTQKELGKRCGIDEANIRKYESGRQRPKMETLQRIADALGISWTYFTDMSGKPESIDVSKKEYDELLEEEKWIEITEKIISSIYGQKKTVRIITPNEGIFLETVDVYGDSPEGRVTFGPNGELIIAQALSSLFYSLAESLKTPVGDETEFIKSHAENANLLIEIARNKTSDKKIQRQLLLETAACLSKMEEELAEIEKTNEPVQK